jgi:alanine racemase
LSPNGGASRPNAVEVDLDAITHNVRAVRNEVGADTKIYGAVKANGYGFGLPRVAEAIVAGGGDGFGLSDPEDALRIRRAGIEAPILLYGGMLPGPEAATFSRRWSLMFPVGELDAAIAMRGTARQPTQVVVEVDVGLERLGVGVEQAVALVKDVSALSGIELMGITTHLHGMGTPDYLEWQLARFKSVVDALAADGVVPELRLAESSATLGIGSHPWFNAVDPGHLLYGLLPRGRTDRPAWLRNALIRITSRLLQVKSVDRREFASESPVAQEEPARIGVIPMGIADGLRALSSGEVLVRGRRCRVAGNLSLEHARVDLSDVPDAERGDEVVVVGTQGDQEITPEDVERTNGIASSGLVLAAGASVQRKYVKSATGKSAPAAQIAFGGDS